VNTVSRPLAKQCVALPLAQAAKYAKQDTCHSRGEAAPKPLPRFDAFSKTQWFPFFAALRLCGNMPFLIPLQSLRA